MSNGSNNYFDLKGELDPLTNLPANKTQEAIFDKLKINSSNAFPLAQSGPNQLLTPETFGGTILGTSSTLDPSKYKFPLIPGRDHDEIRAQQQSWGSMTAKGLARLGLTTLTKFGQGVGYLMGMGNPDNWGDSFINKASKNGLAEFFEGLEEDVKEALPVHHTNKYKGAENIWDQMSTWSFWMDDVVDGVAFMLSTYIPGGALSKLGMGSKLSTTFSRGLRATNTGKLSLPKLQARARNIDRLTTFALMSSTEAMFEAKEVRDRVTQHLQGQINPTTGEPYKANEIKRIAAEKARDTYVMNMIALAPSNYLEAGFLFRKLPSTRGLAKGRIFQEGGKYKLKDLKGFEKFWNGYMGRGLKGVAIGSTTEGLWEENIQYNINKFMEESAENGVMGTSAFSGITNFGKPLSGLFTDMDDLEHQKAIALGAIIGAPASVRAQIMDKRAEDNRLLGEGGALDNLTKSYQDLTRLDVYKKSSSKKVNLSQENGRFYRTESLEIEPNVFGPDGARVEISQEEYNQTAEELGINREQGGDGIETGAVEIDDNGNPIVDEQKLLQHLRQRKYIEDIDSLIDMEEDKDVKNQALINILRNEKFTRWALAHFDAGIAEDLYDKLDMYKGMTQEEIMTLGYDPALTGMSVEEAVQKQKKLAEQLEELYNSVELGTLPASNKKEDFLLNEQRKRTLYEVGARVFSVQNELDREKSRRDSIGSQLQEDEDYDSSLQEINNLILRLDAQEKQLPHLASLSGAEMYDPSKKEEYQGNYRLSRAQRRVDKLKDEILKKKREYNEGKDPAGQIEVNLDPIEIKKLGKGPLGHQHRLQSVKIAELENSLQDLFEEWDSISDVRKGNEYYKNFKDEIAGRLNRGPVTRLPLTSDTSTKMYKNYEERQLKKERLLAKLSNITKEFLSYALIERLSARDPIKDIVKDIISSDLKIEQGAYNNLKEAVDERIKLLRSEIEEAKQLQNELSLGELTAEKAEEMQARVVSLEEKIRDENYLSELSLLGKVLTNEFQKNHIGEQKTPTDMELRRKIADDYTRETDNILDKFNRSDEYMDLPSVERQLGILRNLKRIFEERNDEISKDKVFKGFIKDLENQIKELEKVEVEVNKRLEDRNKLDASILETLKERLYYSIGIDIRASMKEGNIVISEELRPIYNAIEKIIGESQLQSLLNKALEYTKKDGTPSPFPIMFIEGIHQVVREYINDEETETSGEFADVIDRNLETIYEDIGAISKLKNRLNNPRARAIDKQSYSKYKRNPERMVDNIILILREEADIEKGSPVYDYFIHRDIIKLRDEIETELAEGRFERGDLFNFLQLHLRYKTLVDLSNSLESTYNIRDEVISENQNAKDQQKIREKNRVNKEDDFVTPIPSNQQLISIREIVRWFSSTSENLPFKDFAYLKGFAGTGKTNVVVRWAIKMLGLSESQLYTAAHNRPAAEEIRNSVKPSGEIKTIEDLILDLNNRNMESTKLVIVDEAGALSNDQVKQLGEAVYAHNNDPSVNNPVQVLVMGDPNQITRHGTTKSAMEQVHTISSAENVTMINPLTVRFRTNVGIIVQVQNMFMDQEGDLSTTPIQVKSNSENPHKETQDLYGVDGDLEFNNKVKQILALKDSNDGRSRAIIVNSSKVEEYKDLYAPEIAANKVEILDYLEAQGRTIDEVYVNIENLEKEFTTGKTGLKRYNKAMYTATSRASKYLFIGSLPVEHSYSPGVVEVAEAVEEQLLELEKNFINNREEDIDILSIIYGEEVIPVDKTGKEVHENIDEDQDDDISGEGPIDPGDFNNDDDISEDDILTEEEDDVEAVSSEHTPEGTSMESQQEDVVEDTENFNHKIVHTNSNSLNPISQMDRTIYKGVKTGSKVYYVVDKYSDKNGLKHPRVRIVAEVPTPEGIYYREIGVVGKEDIAAMKTDRRTLDLADALEPIVTQGSEASNVSNIEFRTGYYDLLQAPGAESLDDPSYGSVVLAVGTVTKTQGITMVYDWANPRENERGLMRQVIGTYFRTAFPQGSRLHTIDNFMNHSFFKIFTKREVDEINGRQKMQLSAGVPYLVLKSGRNVSPLHYIEFNTRRVRRDDSIVNPFIGENGLINLIEKLEGIFGGQLKYGELLFAETVEKLADKKENESITFMSDTQYQKKQKKKGARRSNVSRKYQGQTISLLGRIEAETGFKFTSKQGLEEARKLAIEIDKLVNKKIEKTDIVDGVEVKKTIRVNGVAQKKFNAIAATNSNNGNSWLRQLKKNGDVKTGKSLLQSEPNYQISDTNVAAGKAMAKVLLKENKITQKQYDDLLDNENQLAIMGSEFNRPLNLQQLKDLFNFNKQGFNQNSLGKSLYYPVKKAEFNKSGNTDVLSNMFTGVKPTSIVVAIKNTSIPQGEIRPARKPDNQKKVDNDDFGMDDLLLSKDRFNEDNLGNRIKSGKVLAAIKRYFPTISDQEIQIVSELEMLRLTHGKEAWGLFRDGILYLAENPDGTIFEEVIRHEVFHRAFNWHLSEGERQLVIAQARAEYPNATRGKDNLEVEEFLAELFQKHVRGRAIVHGWIRAAFNKILEWLGFVSSSIESIDGLFNKIDKGHFSKVSEDVQMGTRFLIKPELFDYSGDVFKMARRIFVSRLASHLNGNVINKTTKKIDYTAPVINKDKSISNLPKTFAEAANAVRMEIIDNYTRMKQAREDQTREPFTPSQEAYFRGLTVLVASDIMEGQTVYPAIDNIIEDMYPGLQEDFSSYLESEEASINGVREDTIEGDRINHERKLSQRVKDFLSTITYRVGDSTDFVSSRQAYRVLLDILPLVDLTSKDSAIASLNSMTFKGSNNRIIAIKAKVNEIIDLAFGEKLVEDITKDIPNDIKFIDDNTFVYSTKRGKDISLIPQSNYEVEGINIIKRNGKSTEAFFKDIVAVVMPVENGAELNHSILKQLFLKGEAVNALRELRAQIGSLRNKNVYRGEWEIDYRKGGLIDMRYYANKPAGKSQSTSAALKSSLISSWEARGISLFSPQLRKLANQKNWTEDEAKDLILGFFRQLGLLGQGESLELVSPMKTAGDIRSLIRGLKENVGKTYKIKDENEDQIQAKVGVTEVLRDQGGRLNRLSKVLGSNSILLEPTSFRHADGTTRYFFFNSNSVIDTIRSFIISKYKQRNFVDTIFFKDNIFIDGTSEIHEYVDHEALFTAKSKYPPKIYKKERENDWLIRNFKLGFLGTLFHEPEDSLKYIQQFWTNSDKPDVLHAKVNHISNEDIIPIIEKAIRQEANRIDPKDNPAFNVKNYNENLNKSFLPGLDRVLTPEEVSNPKTLRKAAREVKKALDKKVNKFIKDYTKRGDIKDDTNAYAVARKLGIKLQGYNISELRLWAVRHLNKQKKPSRPENVAKLLKDLHESDALYNGSISELKNIDKGRALSIQKADREFIKQHALEDIVNKNRERFYSDLLKSYYYNHYLNSHFLNQIAVGDQAFFKNSYDIIKRMSIAFASGYSGLVSPQIGMSETFRMAVGEDILDYISGDFFSKYKNIVGEEFESTDAQGFMTPERFEDIQRGFGRGMNAGITLKPVHFEIDKNGVPRAVKYSSIVITDELAAAFPKLARLREKMRAKNIGEFVFNSAVKVGAPVNQVKYNTKKGEHEEINDESIIELSNSNWRLQLNPLHAADDWVANPTQITYFLNTNGQNWNQAVKAYMLNSKLINRGLANLKYDLNLTRFSSKEQNLRLRERIARSLEGVTGTERQWEFLTAKDDKGDYLTSLNFPLIVDKLITQLASITTKATVKIKFPGTKLVLQSAYGSDEINPSSIKGFSPEVAKILKDNKLYPPKWRNEEGYAEMYLPDTYQKQLEAQGLKVGDMVLYDKMLGFRIPSTELHSAIPIKVLGFYPAPNNENIVIAPPEIVFFHGSDYDIDSLFVIRYDIPTNNLTNEKGDIVVKANEITLEKNGKELYEWVEEEIERMNAYKKMVGQASKEWTESEHKLYMSRLTNFRESTIKNAIVKNILDVIIANRNQNSMMTPISTENFKGKRSKEGAHPSVFDTLVKARGLKSHEDLYPPRDLNDVTDQMSMHQDNFRGVQLTGIFANQVKGLAYAFHGAGKNQVPLIGVGNPVIIDGIKYNKLSRTEKIADKEGNLVDNEIIIGFEKELDEAHYKKTGKKKFNFKKDSAGNKIPIKHVPTIWETMDSLINAALDNVKDQILSPINATNTTANAYTAAVSLGIPINTVSLLMTQPAVLELSRIGYFDTALKKVREDIEVRARALHQQSKTTEPFSIPMTVSSKNLKLHSYTTLDKLQQSNDWKILAEQLAILNTIESLNNIGSSIGDIASAARVTQELPVEFSEILRKMNTFDSMYNLDTNNQYKKAVHIKHLTLDEKQNFLSKAINNRKIIKENIAVMLADRPNLSEEEKESLTVTADQIRGLSEEKIDSILDSLNLMYAPYDWLSKNETVKDATLREANKTYNKMLLQKVDGRVLKADFAFTNVDVLNIPHINSAFDGLKMLKSTVEHMFHKHNKSLQRMIKSVVKNTGIELHRFSHVNEGMLRNEFVKMILSNISFEIENRAKDGGIRIKNYTFSTVKEKAYEYKNRFGVKRQIVGTEAWNQRFIERVEKIKKQYKKRGEQNRFLEGIEIVNNWKTGLKKINYTTGGTLEQIDIVDFEKDFLSLNGADGNFTEFQYDFVKYDVLNRGVAFGSNSYSQLLPPEIYSQVNKALDEKMRDIFDHEDLEIVTEKLDRLQDVFEIQLSINKSDNLGFPRNKKRVKINGKYSGVDTFKGKRNPVWFDAAYELTEEENGTDYEQFPRIIGDIFDNVLIKLPYAEGDKHVYYQKLASKKEHEFYMLPRQYKTKKYSSTQIVSREARTINTDNNDVKQYSVPLQYDPKFAKNQIIRLVNNGDTIRENIREYKVIDAKREKGKATYNLEFIRKIDTFVSIEAKEKTYRQTKKDVELREQIQCD